MNGHEEIENLKRFLNQVRDQDLREYCRLQGIQFPEEATKKQIIDIIAESPPTDLDNSLGTAFRLELRSTESSVRKAIEDKAIILTAAAEATIKSAMKEVAVAKWLLGGTGAALAIIVAALGVSSTRKISDFDKEIKETTEVRKDLQTLRQQSVSVLTIYRQHMINQWVEAIDNVMETFSTSLPDDKPLATFLTYRNSIDQMIGLSSTDQSTLEQTVLQRIRDICQALSSVAEWREIEKTEKIDPVIWDAKATASEQRWDQLAEISVSSDTPGSFLRRSNAFRRNALGIVYLKRYLRSEKRKRLLDDLNNADAHFDKAVSYDKTFGRAHSNRGAVLYWKFIRATDSTEKKDLIARAIDAHVTSTRYLERSSGGGRSRTFNNIAAYLLQEARLYEKEDPLKAKESLGEAETQIAKSLDQDSIVSTAYVTKIEIASYNLYLLHRADLGVKVRDASEARSLVELAKLASDKGYSCSARRDLPFLESIKSLYPTVVEEVYTILRTPSE